MLLDEDALRDRLDAVYSRMRERAKPRKYKSGKRTGSVRIPGIVGLPFTRDEFWEHAVTCIGPTGITRCPYCVEIGRPATLITLVNCVFDHKVPVARGGAWELSNLPAVCATCNNEKGHLTYEFFIALMSEIERWPDQKDRAHLCACLRSYGVTQRIRFQFDKKPPVNKTRTGSDTVLPLLDPTF